MSAGHQGESVAGGQQFVQHDPADLRRVTGTYADASAAEIEAAIAAANAAFAGWRATSVQARKAILDRALQAIIARREEIAALITRENGKTLPESLAEVDSAIREMDFQIGEGLRLCGQTLPVETEGTLAYSTRAPRGAAGVITPWNFPFNVPCRKCTPALMAGNTVVLKPASLTPGTGQLYADILNAAGLPPGVLTCLTGGGSRVGRAIVADPRIRAISFTGSTAVGKAIQAEAAAHLTPTQLELGGKNPVIVMPDADLDAATREILRGALACSGQWCTSTSRVIVLPAIADELVARLREQMLAVRVGPGAAAASGMGPVCGAQQKADVLSYIETGIAEGGQLVCGGHALEAGELAHGAFIAPTLFDHVTPTMRIAQEEIFGPVLVVLRVADFEDAVRVANDVAYGLSSSIFTRDLRYALEFMERTEVGLAHVNLMSALKEPQLPFGGIKASGAGLPEAGSAGIEFFTEHKVCYVKYR